MFGNLAVAVALSALQVLVVVGAAALRGAEYHLSVTGVGWFVAAAFGFAVAMYGLAEVLANRLPTQEEYIGALPPVAIVPWFLAGSLFPISALPAGLTVVAKVLPNTHVLALLRYGLVDRSGQGLHDIWGMSNTTAMAALSPTVVAVFAVALTAISIRVFTRPGQLTVPAGSYPRRPSRSPHWRDLMTTPRPWAAPVLDPPIAHPATPDRRGEPRRLQLLEPVPESGEPSERRQRRRTSASCIPPRWSRWSNTGPPADCTGRGR